MHEIDERTLSKTVTVVKDDYPNAKQEKTIMASQGQMSENDDSRKSEVGSNNVRMMCGNMIIIITYAHPRQSCPAHCARNN